MYCENDCWGHLLGTDNIVHLRKRRTRVGRDPKNDIVLPDNSGLKMVSSFHANIVSLGSRGLLVDTSLNGTYINGKRVRRSILRTDDIVRFGKWRGGNLTFVVSLRKAPGLSRNSTNHAMNVQAVLSSLRCGICKDYLVFPAELSPCTHLVCSSCLEAISTSDSRSDCPICSTTLSTYKVTTKYNLVSIILSVMKLVLREDELTHYMERFERRKSVLTSRQEQLALLRSKYEAAPTSSLCFLSIHEPWTPYEKLKFHKGVSKYLLGESREFFCWMVGLTQEWVLQRPGETDMATALFNLDLLQSMAFKDRSTTVCQDALLRFIYAKKQK